MKKLIINLPNNINCVYTSIYENKTKLDYRWLPTEADITIVTLTGKTGGKPFIKEFFNNAEKKYD